MGSENLKRYISKKVAEELWNLSRGRCCLCRMIIPAEKSDWADISDYLERHHLIYHSKGGDNSIENLVLVCPNCHSAIHKFPQKYSVEGILKKKNHWISLKDCIPNILVLPGKKYRPSLDDSNYNQFIQIRAEIHLITMNLHYFIVIKAGDLVTIKELSDFVLSNIITPMAEYDDNYLWKDINNLELAYESDLNKRIDSNKIVKACIKKNDPFIPILKITHQYAALGAGRIAVLRANIKDPFKDLLNLRHTTKTLLQTHGFAGPLEDLDLLESWLQMIDDQYSRRWLKKIVLLLDNSPAWKETLHHYRDKMQDEDQPIINVDKFFNEMQMMCKKIYDTVTAGVDINARVPLDKRRMVLWSIIRGHMMESIKALIELKRYTENAIMLTPRSFR